MARKKTVKVRMNQGLRNELRTNFDEVPMPALLDMMWKTSALRAENGLRKFGKKKNR